MINLLEVKNIDDLNNSLVFSNIKLLEKPNIIDNNTIIKIITDIEIKTALKRIENLINLEFKINFDLHSKNDYYILVVNKKINKLVNQLSIEHIYNIGVKFIENSNNWILESIEIVNPDEIDVNDIDEEDIVDYESIKDELFTKIDVKINHAKNTINNTNNEIETFSNMKNEILNNFNKNKIEEYFNLINF